MQILVIILAIWVRLPIWPFRRDRVMEPKTGIAPVPTIDEPTRFEAPKATNSLFGDTAYPYFAAFSRAATIESTTPTTELTNAVGRVKLKYFIVFLYIGHPKGRLDPPLILPNTSTPMSSHFSTFVRTVVPTTKIKISGTYLTHFPPGVCAIFCLVTLTTMRKPKLIKLKSAVGTLMECMLLIVKKSLERGRVGGS